MNISDKLHRFLHGPFKKCVLERLQKDRYVPLVSESYAMRELREMAYVATRCAIPLIRAQVRGGFYASAYDRPKALLAKTVKRMPSAAFRVSMLPCGVGAAVWAIARGKEVRGNGA